MGTYSDTAPYDCPKSKRILDEACKVLDKEPLEENLWGAVNGLALLSTGRPEYLPKVRGLAAEIGPEDAQARILWLGGVGGRLSEHLP